MDYRKQLFYLLYIILWLSNGILLKIGVHLEQVTTIFFLCLSFIIFSGMLLDIYLANKGLNWADIFLLELGVYYIIKERLHRGTVFDVLEIVITLILLLLSLLINYRKNIWKFFSQKIFYFSLK
ncbi:MAG: hypothetical protein E6R13_04855 [Spirochaetes bacterium]|nr:MAG: hypothetical protein E6R13_04855 [Spirochaetota bacterium]